MFAFTIPLTFLENMKGLVLVKHVSTTGFLKKLQEMQGSDSTWSDSMYLTFYTSIKKIHNFFMYCILHYFLDKIRMTCFAGLSHFSHI